MCLPNIKNKKSLTCFAKPGHIRQAVEPICHIAKKRGYDIDYTTDYTKDAHIGIYSDHVSEISEVNADLSIVMPHGVDQYYTHNQWTEEEWKDFDVGFVIGEYMAKKWQSESWWPGARPSIGVYKVGWPKSDKIDTKQYNSIVDKKRDEIPIQNKNIILYAPSGPVNNTAINILNSIPDSGLIIKPAPWKKTNIKTPDVKNIHLANKNDDIFPYLSISDIVVSSKSSVLLEAVLTETVPVSVIDWIPITQSEVQYSQIPPCAKITTETKLSNKVTDIIDNINSERAKIIHERDQHFSNIGDASKVAVNIIDSLIDGERTEQKQIIKPRLSKRNYIIHSIRQNIIESVLPESVLQQLSGSQLHQLLRRMYS